MHISRFPFPFRSALAGVLLAGAAATSTPLQAGETPILNGAIDDLAPTPAWYWENWSQPGSELTYDDTRNAAGGGAGSGSLRLSAPFVAQADWQQAVFTLDSEDFNGNNYQSVSFDVKVDPTSIARAAGDYGSIQMILRNGAGWDWREEAFVPLTGTDWRRVTFNLRAGGQPINDVRLLTLRVAQSALAGPVTVNVDNIVLNDELVVANFDDSSIEGWTATWGTAPELEASSLDRQGRQTSGSLKVSAPYFDPAVTAWQQAVITVPITETNVSAAYTHVNVDVRVDPSSVPTGGGNYGLFEIKTAGATIGGATLTGTEWTRLSFAIAPGVGTINALIFQLGAGDMKGPVTYNLDNLTFSVRTEAPPPPSLKLAKASAGLNLVHTASDQYGRHNIFTTDNSTLGWSDSATPTTYEFTLLSFPNATDYNGFQAHVFLVPGTPGTETGPDWNQPNLVFLDIKAAADGSGNATFRWKTNLANGNSALYAAGLSNVTSTTVTGTWKITATQNSHFTVTAPSGATTTVDFDAETAALFAGPIRMYVGVQGNNPNNIGQGARIGGIKISQGATVLLEDNFTGDVLDETKWTVNSAAGGVQYLTPAEAGFLVSWGLPDDGFVLQWTGSLKAPVTWTDSTATAVNVGPLRKQASIPKSELPPGAEAYFRLRAP